MAMVGSFGRSRRIICHVVPFFGFQMWDVSVLFNPAAGGLPDSELELGEDELNL